MDSDECNTGVNVAMDYHSIQGGEEMLIVRLHSAEIEDKRRPDSPLCSCSPSLTGCFFLFPRHASVYGSVFAIEDFAASVGFAFGTCSANSAY